MNRQEAGDIAQLRNEIATNELCPFNGAKCSLMCRAFQPAHKVLKRTIGDDYQRNDDSYDIVDAACLASAGVIREGDGQYTLTTVIEGVLIKCVLKQIGSGDYVVQNAQIVDEIKADRDQTVFRVASMDILRPLLMRSKRIGTRASSNKRPADSAGWIDGRGTGLHKNSYRA